jgi:rhamnosyltransferase
MKSRSEPRIDDYSTAEYSPCHGRVCAVVVTYNPGPALLNNISAVANQVDEVIIVDNDSSGDALRRLTALEGRGIHVLRNHCNRGIAVALNQGIRLALSLEFPWILTLDQDSKVTAGFVHEMLQTFRLAGNPESIALIAPSYIDQHSGIRVHSTRNRDGSIITAMTSGSLTSAAAIRALGPFDESLFMDYVDTEYCLRARRQGMVILQSPAVLFHSLGKTTFHHFLGFRYGVTNHSWQRRYYITRNRLRLLLRYYTDWPWVWREIRAFFLHGAKIALVEQDKWKKFRAMAGGTADAFLGKVGKQVEL